MTRRRKYTDFPHTLSLFITTKALENSIYQEKGVNEANLLSANTKDTFISYWLSKLITIISFYDKLDV